MGSVEWPKHPRLVVSLCTFNERENLAALIPELRSIVPGATILVVDDNSPDGTGELVRQMAEHDPALRLISRSGKLGLGSATVAAFRFAIEEGFDAILNLDADFSHPPRFIPNLLAAAARVDVVIGSRYVPGGETPGWSLKRRLMSRSINAYARLLLGLETHDNSGAFRCYRVAKLKEVPFERIRSTGYAFQEEILFRCRKAGCTFAEVPITFEERRFGQTKINWREAVTALGVIAVLPWERDPGSPAADGTSRDTTKPG